jgi:hypothetical protein
MAAPTLSPAICNYYLYHLSVLDPSIHQCQILAFADTTSCHLQCQILHLPILAPSICHTSSFYLPVPVPAICNIEFCHIIVSDPPICPSPSPAKLYAAVCHPPVRKPCIMPIPALAVCQYQLMLPASTQIMSSVNTGSCYLQISARSHAICQYQSLVSGSSSSCYLLVP